MTSRTTVVVVDDLDGRPADTTLRFSLEHEAFEIDLSTQHADELRRLLAPYMAAGRRLPVALSPAPGQTPDAMPSFPPAREHPWVPLAKVTRAEAAAVRAWAQERGIPMPHLGTPWSVVKAYRSRDDA